MGSARSKPRKGHERPKHLPKVGTPANLEWERQGRREQVFGSGVSRVLIGALVALALLGLVLIAL